MSEIRVTTISDTAGTGPVTLTKQQAAKAWINLNGTGTVAIKDSFNVASIADEGTGAYQTNFSSNMGNVNYAVSGSAGDGGCLLYTSPSPRDQRGSRMPSSA